MPAVKPEYGKLKHAENTSNPYNLPVAEKTYLFKELYIETIIMNPKNVGLSGYR